MLTGPLLAGLVALLRVPIQMTPEVQSVVIAVTTTWEGASAQEIAESVLVAAALRAGGAITHGTHALKGI